MCRLFREMMWRACSEMQWLSWNFSWSVAASYPSTPPPTNTPPLYSYPTRKSRRWEIFSLEYLGMMNFVCPWGPCWGRWMYLFRPPGRSAVCCAVSYTSTSAVETHPPPAPAQATAMLSSMVYFRTTRPCSGRVWCVSWVKRPTKRFWIPLLWCACIRIWEFCRNFPRFCSPQGGPASPFGGGPASPSPYDNSSSSHDSALSRCVMSLKHWTAAGLLAAHGNPSMDYSDALSEVKALLLIFINDASQIVGNPDPTLWPASSTALCALKDSVRLLVIIVYCCSNNNP